jgi:hypothetical protein
MNHIKLNDILNLSELSTTKVRFNLNFASNWNPIEFFRSGDITTMINGQYWNYNNKSFKLGQTTIGLVRINPKENFFLLYHVGKVTKDLNVLNGVGYEYEHLVDFQKYVGRLVVYYKNKDQQLIRNAISVIDECFVSQILPDTFDNDLFPGYEKVNISWSELGRVLEKDNWKTALQNQKGVYLITDTFNGKVYVGSAYGEEMILGRWRSYIKNGHGGNIGMKQLTFEYIQNYFRFSLLDTFKSSIDDKVIIERENWWKEIFLSRTFGYNQN